MSTNTAYKDLTSYLGARTQTIHINNPLAGRGTNAFHGLTAKSGSINTSSSGSSLNTNAYSATSRSHFNQQLSANTGSLTHPGRQLIVNEHSGDDTQRYFSNNRSPPVVGTNHYRGLQTNAPFIHSNTVSVQQKNRFNLNEQANTKFNVGSHTNIANGVYSSNRGTYQPRSHVSLTGHSISKINGDGSSDNSIGAYSAKTGTNIHRVSSINTPSFYNAGGHEESTNYLSLINNINRVKNVGDSSGSIGNGVYTTNDECHHQASSANSASIYQSENNERARNHIDLSRQTVGQIFESDGSKRYHVSSAYLKSSSEGVKNSINRGSDPGNGKILSKTPEGTNDVSGSTSPVTFPTPHSNNLPSVTNNPIQIAQPLVFQVPHDLYIPVAPYVVSRTVKNPIVNPVPIPIPVPVPVAHVPPHLRGQQTHTTIAKSPAPVKENQSYLVNSKPALRANVPQSYSETAKQPVVINVQQFYPVIAKPSPLIDVQKIHTETQKSPVPVNVQQFYVAKSRVPTNIQQSHAATAKPPVFVDVPRPYRANVKPQFQIIVPQTPAVSHQVGAGQNGVKQETYPSFRANIESFGSRNFNQNSESFHRGRSGNTKQEFNSGEGLPLEYSRGKQ